MKRFKEIKRREGTKLLLWERTRRYFVEEMGFKEGESRSSKYIKIERAEGMSPIFIGKAGAIRAGKSAADSISVTDLYMPRIELWEKTSGKGDRF